MDISGGSVPVSMATRAPVGGRFLASPASAQARRRVESLDEVEHDFLHFYRLAA